MAMPRMIKITDKTLPLENMLLSTNLDHLEVIDVGEERCEGLLSDDLHSSSKCLKGCFSNLGSRVIDCLEINKPSR